MKMQGKLLVLRREHDLTQEDLAKLLGIATQTYGQKELGNREFTANEMFLIANYFGLKVDDIFWPTLLQNGVKQEEGE